jgi:hypothetical protein
MRLSILLGVFVCRSQQAPTRLTSDDYARAEHARADAHPLMTGTASQFSWQVTVVSHTVAHPEVRGW